MMSDHADVIVAGSGVIGLAVARALSLSGRRVLVIEAEDKIGTGVSSRSSEVVHGGIYYPPDSLKASLCVEGRERLYAYCVQRGIPFRRTGKLIVATETQQIERLEALQGNANCCGVSDVSRLTAAQAKSLEPELDCVGALLSPSTGIIDSHAYMLALQGEAEAHGAQFAFNARIERGAVTPQGIQLCVRDRGSNEALMLSAECFVNAAGLGASDLAQSLEGFPIGFAPRLYLARGCYFSLRGRSPFSHLIYPLPVQGGLGVHLTLDLANAARFGPDVEWIDALDYSVDPGRALRFYGEIRRYWRALPDEALLPAYAGVRPKISGPTEAAADFRIDGPRVHGVAGCVHLFGIESPGLTASLAIAEAVRKKLDE